MEALLISTGVVALALNQFPVGLPLLHEAGAVLWMANIVLFAVCTLLYAARWIFFPSAALPIFNHPVMPMFLGAIPMGLATIVNGFLAFGIARRCANPEPHRGFVRLVRFQQILRKLRRFTKTERQKT